MQAMFSLLRLCHGVVFHLLGHGGCFSYWKGQGSWMLAYWPYVGERSLYIYIFNQIVRLVLSTIVQVVLKGLWKPSCNVCCFENINFRVLRTSIEARFDLILYHEVRNSNDLNELGVCILWLRLVHGIGRCLKSLYFICQYVNWTYSLYGNGCKRAISRMSGSVVHIDLITKTFWDIWDTHGTHLTFYKS